MYQDWFGLDEAPFKITPDTRLFYEGGKRGDILEALQYAITSGEGIVKVVGEVGSGKTMLSRMLEVRMSETVDLVYLANPSIDPAEIPFAIGVELGLPIEPGTDRIHAVHMLQEALLARHAKGRQVVVFVEEAQSMPLATLEEVRLLSNLETHRAKLLQIVLFGQPELDVNLDEPSIRQLRERIVHSFNLDPLGALDVGSYVSFRMRAVGYRGPDVFSKGALKLMSKHSEGLIRRVNVLGDKALLAAFADNTHEVTEKHVRIAIKDSTFGRTRAPRRWPARVALVAVVILAVAAGVWLSRYLPGMNEPAAPATSAAPAPAVAPTPAVPPTQVPVNAGTAPAVPAAAPAVAAGQGASGQPASAQASAAQGAVASPSDTPAVAADTVPDVGTLIPVSNVPPGEVASVNTAAADVAGGESPVASAVRDAVTEGSVESVTAAVVAATNTAQASVAGRTAAAAAAVSTVPAAPAPAGAVTAAPLPSTPPPSTPVPSTPPPSTPESIASASSAPVPADGTNAAAGATGASAAGDSLVEARLEATRRWYAAVDKDRFSIQLLMTSPSRRESLEAFLRRWQAAGDVSRVYVYRARIGDADWYGVLLDEFESVEAAQAVIARLPESLKRHRPYVRNIRDIGGLG